MAFFDEIVGRVRLIRERFHKLNQADKRRLILICAAVLSVLLIIIFTASLFRGKKPDETDRETLLLPIPPDELFLPEEPDFIPGVLLERERRSSWSEEDAMEYWQDPLKAGEEEWRIKIENEIDKFLERVP